MVEQVALPIYHGRYVGEAWVIDPSLLAEGGILAAFFRKLDVPGSTRPIKQLLPAIGGNDDLYP